MLFWERLVFMLGKGKCSCLLTCNGFIHIYRATVECESKEYLQRGMMVKYKCPSCDPHA